MFFLALCDLRFIVDQLAWRLPKKMELKKNDPLHLCYGTLLAQAE